MKPDIFRWRCRGLEVGCCSLGLTLLLCFGGSAPAPIGTINPLPPATFLLPHFQPALNHPNPLPPPFPPAPTGLAAGQPLGDTSGRGYVPRDTVNHCSLRFPGDVGYFAAGGTGDVTNDNGLWGDWFIINAAQGSAEGGTLVHIEASATD